MIEIWPINNNHTDKTSKMIERTYISPWESKKGYQQQEKSTTKRQRAQRIAKLLLYSTAVPRTVPETISNLQAWAAPHPELRADL